MGERLKLKVSPKGQITLPKKVRSSLNIREYIYLEVKNNKVELKPVSLVEEMKELVVRDLQHEGYGAQEIQEMLPGKMNQLSKVLAKELKKRSQEYIVSHAGFKRVSDPRFCL